MLSAKFKSGRLHPEVAGLRYKASPGRDSLVQAIACKWRVPREVVRQSDPINLVSPYFPADLDGDEL
jgi:hypothetical protein